MQITMTETRDGSPDGIQVKTFTEGETYDVPEDLASVFLREKWAKEVKVKEVKPETKAQTGAPENKGAQTSKKADGGK